MKDYYYILGIELTAAQGEIKTAFRKLAHKIHPDKNEGDKFFEERFKDIYEAYEVLSNDAKRKERGGPQNSDSRVRCKIHDERRRIHRDEQDEADTVFRGVQGEGGIVGAA